MTAAGRRRTRAEVELSMLLATDLEASLREAYGDWLAKNLTKTSGPMDVSVGLGLFLTEALGALAFASGMTEAAWRAHLADWFGDVVAGAWDVREAQRRAWIEAGGEDLWRHS